VIRFKVILESFSPLYGRPGGGVCPQRRRCGEISGEDFSGLPVCV